jgi:rhomboid protease GluP
MDYQTVIFWLILFSCLTLLAVTIPRARSLGFGWIVVAVVIMFIAIAGSICKQASLVYLAGILWLILVLLTALLSRVYTRLFLQQRYLGARRLARVIAWLHPADGWREQPRIVEALFLAQKGELPAAIAILDRYRNTKSSPGMTAVAHFYRLTDDWEGFLRWQIENPELTRRQPQFLPIWLRAKGETGAVKEMIDLYATHKEQIRKLVPPSSRGMARIPLFAFCGRRNELERLFAGPLAVLPGTTRDFWLATADLAAGRTESARQQFEHLLSTDDASLRQAVQRRLARRQPANETLDADSAKLIEEAANDDVHEQKFGGGQTLFSRRALITQILIVLNLVMFMVELHLGGGENPETLYRLGALCPISVWSGEWWRLIASLFLHAG